MTGKAREHEVRLMGFGLAAVALLTAALALWVAVSVGHQLRAPTQGTPVTQSSSALLGLNLVEHG